jgi:hypothetical protein
MKRKRPYFKAPKIKSEQMNQRKFAETLKKNLDEVDQLAGPNIQNHYNQLGKCIMYAVRSSLTSLKDTGGESKLKESTRRLIEERERETKSGSRNQRAEKDGVSGSEQAHKKGNSERPQRL